MVWLFGSVNINFVGLADDALESRERGTETCSDGSLCYDNA